MRLLLSLVLASVLSAVDPTLAVSPPANPALSGRVITIDPGHNGGNFTHPQEIARLIDDGNGEKECDTTGTAAPDGYRETDFNWDVAQRLRALALALAAGARVVLTRHSNTGVGPRSQTCRTQATRRQCSGRRFASRSPARCSPGSSAS